MAGAVVGAAIGGVVGWRLGAAVCRGCAAPKRYLAATGALTFGAIGAVVGVPPTNAVRHARPWTAR